MYRVRSHFSYLLIRNTVIKQYFVFSASPESCYSNFYSCQSPLFCIQEFKYLRKNLILGKKVEKKLGKRIQHFRESRSMSLESLAERTGLSKEFLQGLEENQIYPSIGPLQKIACALGVRLGTFMDDEISKDPIINSLHHSASDLAIQRCRTSNVSYAYSALAAGKSDRNMDPFYMTILPCTEEEQTSSSHQGEEFILVLKGQIKIVYGLETHILDQGQSIYYNSIVPHHVSAYQDEAAEILAVIYHP